MSLVDVTTRNDYDTTEDYAVAGVTRPFFKGWLGGLKLVVIVDQTARPLLSAPGRLAVYHRRRSGVSSLHSSCALLA